MTRKRYLAVDPGERRSGLAGTDWTGTICVPLGRIEHRGMAALPDLLAPIVSERQSEVLVVGLPLGADGQPGPQAGKVLALVAQLRLRLPALEIVTQDEAHSTDDAHAALKSAGLKAARRKRHSDELAALFILQRYLGEK